MAQFPPLENSPINLAALRKESQDELVQALNSMHGKKAFIIDPKLSGPLSLIAEISLLKEHGVESLAYLSPEPITSACNNVFYVVRPVMELMEHVAAQIRYDIQKQQQRQYTLFFMPRRSTACEKILEDRGVHGAIRFGEYSMLPVSFDDDVLSLENDLLFKELHVDGNTTSLCELARIVNKLQSRFGLIPNVKGKGDAAKTVYGMMKRMQEEEPFETPEKPQIDTLILFDRQVDMVTPMCSQLTYEGLIDEFLNINNGCIEVDPEIVGGQSEKKKKKVHLNSSDKLYRDLRDLNFGVVGGILREKAAAMKQDYTDVKSTNQEIADLKKFVKKLHALPEMSQHIGISQYLTNFTTKRAFRNRLSMEQTLVEGQEFDICHDYIEEMIAKQEPLISVLRLLVMLSVTNNGLPKKQFDFIRRELLASYSTEHLRFLANLEKVGLLKKQDSKSSWMQIKRGLKLVVNDADDANPKDISYAFSGYAPVSIRLVQHALTGGWRSKDDRFVEEAIKLLPGATFEDSQGVQRRSPSMNNVNDASLLSNNLNGRRSLVLVVFIGGVTFAEISALRFLSSQDSMKHDVMVLTTKLINGTSMLQSLQDSLVL